MTNKITIKKTIAKLKKEIEVYEHKLIDLEENKHYEIEHEKGLTQEEYESKIIGLATAQKVMQENINKRYIEIDRLQRMAADGYKLVTTGI